MQKDDVISKIDVADVEACNGIVHVVDQVILPNLEKMPTSFLSFLTLQYWKMPQYNFIGSNFYFKKWLHI